MRKVLNDKANYLKAKIWTKVKPVFHKQVIKIQPTTVQKAAENCIFTVKKNIDKEMHYVHS
jgi:hypothetical protein